MAIYRTAQGRPLDMSQLAAKNEKVRAVGNMSVNARGDTIDASGKVITPVTKKVGKNYQNAVSGGTRATNIVKPKEQNTVSVDEVQQPPVTQQLEPVFEELSDEDLEFLQPTDEDLEIEKIKAAEIEAAKTKKK